MNTIKNRPFELAEIEIVNLVEFDIITASPTGDRFPFDGEEEPLYWEQNL